MTEDELKGFNKFKLVYSGELLLFAVIFIVLSVLFILKVIPIKDWKIWVFPIVTLLGGIWCIIDFIWFETSKKRKLKNSFIDKALPLPAALCLIPFDIYMLINNASLGAEEGYRSMFSLVIGIILGYYGLVYLFEGIYHYFVPAKACTYAYEEALEQEKALLAKEEEQNQKEEPNEYEITKEEFEIELEDKDAD